MIKSAVVKINKINNFDNCYIESELRKLYRDIVRWAVIDVDDADISISVSYIA